MIRCRSTTAAEVPRVSRWAARSTAREASPVRATRLAAAETVLTAVHPASAEAVPGVRRARVARALAGPRTAPLRDPVRPAARRPVRAAWTSGWAAQRHRAMAEPALAATAARAARRP